MKLYHGTTEAIARGASTNGIQTRDTSGAGGNWEHSVDSAGDCVYLSVAYASYFAYCAAANGESWGIIEVDTNLLDTDDMRPDEDFLEQATRKQEVPIPKDDFDDEAHIYDELREANDIKDGQERMKARTEFFRENMEWYAQHWEDSIKFLGNCSHFGDIPPSAITRVTIFDPTSNAGMAMAVDPSITLLNYKICEGKYRAITKWLAGYEVDPDELCGLIFPSAQHIMAPEDIEKMPEDLQAAPLKMSKLMTDTVAAWKNEVIPMRDGLEVIYLAPELT